MLSKEIQTILEDAGKTGWVVEPEAKKLLSLAGLNVPRFTWATGWDQALQFAHAIGYPVAVKVVSPASHDEGHVVKHSLCQLEVG